LNEKFYFLGFLVIARRPPTGGCRSNLIESLEAKRLLSFARNDSVTQNLPFSFSHCGEHGRHLEGLSENQHFQAKHVIPNEARNRQQPMPSLQAMASVPGAHSSIIKYEIAPRFF